MHFSNQQFINILQEKKENYNPPQLFIEKKVQN